MRVQQFNEAKEFFNAAFEKAKGSVWKKASVAFFQLKNKYGDSVYCKIHIDDEYSYLTGWSYSSYKEDMSDKLLIEISDYIIRKKCVGRFKKAHTYTAEKSFMIFVRFNEID